MATALIGSALAIATLALAIVDRDASPWLPLPGLSNGATNALRLAEQTLGVVSLSVVAGLIARRERNVFVWAITALALCYAVAAFLGQYALHGLVVAPDVFPLGDAAARLQALQFGPMIASVVVAALTFPDGRLLSRRWLALVVAVFAVTATDLLVRLDQPYPIGIGLTPLQNVPATMPPEWWAIGQALRWADRPLFWSWFLLAPLIGVAVALRYRRSRGDERLQLKWFLFATALGVIASIAGRIDGVPLVNEALGEETANAIARWGLEVQNAAITILLPVAVGIAILRYRLYHIDVVISRAIRYGGLIVFFALTYGVVVAAVGAVLGQGTGFGPIATVLAIALTALLLDPVRARLNAFANVLVYGRRASPYEVLSEFSRAVSHAERSEVLLPQMARTVLEGTRAASVEVWVRVGERLQLAAAAPEARERDSARDVSELEARSIGAVVAPVHLEDEELGALVVRRPRAEELNATELRLLHDLASQAGLVFSRFRLVEELRESRTRLVVAQDDERRRIERDLHDGAQQRFVNAMLAVGMAQASDGADPETSDLLAQAKSEMQAGLVDLRSLARGLRPPLLAEEGLPAAIASLVDRCPIMTSVSVETTRRYPPSIEATAYFVVAEALTNAAKHSRASRITVRVAEHDGRLRVEVRDDGTGAVDASRGSGITGLRDRAAAVGGTVSARSDGGTVVDADLPCA